MTMDPAVIWQAALTRLEGSMASATFNECFRNTKAVAVRDKTIIVQAQHQAALEWLTHRLQPLCERILRELGYELTVAFTLEETQPPDLPLNTKSFTLPPPSSPTPYVSIEVVEYDPLQRGWIKTSAYALQFWQPYLKQGPFLLWQTLRSFARESIAWPSIRTLADIVANGNKQLLIGKTERGQWREGWLDILERERIVWPRQEEKQYIFRVLDSLPLLTPAQISTLSEQRQKAHTRFLEQCKVDLDEWNQMTVPTITDIERRKTTPSRKR